VTPDPDVTPVGFAATDAPGAIVRRRRNPVWLALAVLLTVAGLAGIALFIAKQIDNAPGRDQAVATGRIAALGDDDVPAARFTGGGDYTVWVDMEGVSRSNRRETIVAATNCEAGFANGGSARFRGARQGASVTIGNRSTAGTFDAPEGAVALSCRLLPFGRYGNRYLLSQERSFFVTPGRPGVGFLLWVWMFAGIGFLILALPAFGRYRAGTLRPRMDRIIGRH
jgi:hypothetical protein